MDDIIKRIKELEEEITERKRVEDMLRKNEEWVRAISESANDAIICIDDTGIVNFWNKKAEEMFGYSTVLRSLTQGKAQFTMEFATYKQIPQSVAEELEKKVAEELSTFGNWETTFIKEGTVYGKIDGAKISLISYPFFKPSESFLKIGTISILSPKDIGAMKIIAISQRGKKRDFFDLYWISKNIQPLSKSIEIMQKHYIVKQNDGHILKSLTYFNDAEDDKDPIINFKASWKEVKNFFKKEALNMARIGNK